MPHTAPSLIRVGPLVTAVIAQTTTWAEFPKLWPRLLSQVYGFVRTRPDLATGTSDELWQNVMLYKNDTPDVEVGVLVSMPFEAAGPVTASALPGGEVATATLNGDYAQLGATHGAVREFVAAQARELAGPRWEIYGHARPDPTGQETQVFWLVR